MRAVFLSTVLPFAPWAAALKRHLPELDLCCWPETGDRATIGAALVWYPPPGALAQFPALRFIHSLGAGVDHILADPHFPAGATLVRLVDPAMTTAMTEYVALQVLRLHLHDIAYREQQAARIWRELDQPLAAVRPVGILGLGVLGTATALRLNALGFDVAGWSRGERQLPGIACHHGSDGLARLLARSEILVCLLPLTPATENILDARLFAALPRGAALVNCARGAHLVEADLLAALDSGQVSAAALDVFRAEPLPPDHPFWRHPRIVVTPHVAAATPVPTAAAIIAAALRSWAEGKEPANVVAPARGY